MPHDNGWKPVDLPRRDLPIIGAVVEPRIYSILAVVTMQCPCRPENPPITFVSSTRVRCSHCQRSYGVGQALISPRGQQAQITIEDPPPEG